jgi:hypothetical protein
MINNSLVEGRTDRMAVLDGRRGRFAQPCMVFSLILLLAALRSRHVF